MARSYDARCYELATVFLSDAEMEGKLVFERDRMELAQIIQESIENYLEYELQPKGADHASSIPAPERG
jgi:hypothetical protein